MKNNSTTVSVCMISYNHEHFIREAIEGVLMQKTNFPIELIIGEDCSTDGTRDIVLEYAAKYPDIIRPLLPEKNLGMSKNFMETLQACTGKYIALCEGDDYWTDPYKLQKQVDFLEANEEYSICSHRYSIYHETSNVFEPDVNIELFKNNESGYSFDLKGFFNGWYLHTMSVLFRRSSMDMELINKLDNVFDYMLFYSIMKNGKGYLFNFNGGVYRKHAGGVCTSNTTINHSTQHYQAFKQLFTLEKTEILKEIVAYQLFHHLKSYIKYSEHFSLNYIFTKSKELFNYKVIDYSILIFIRMILKSATYRIVKK